jgi:undecaprenyl-diphosphatase
VLWYFADDWVRLIRAAAASIAHREIGGDPDRRLAWFLVIGCVPGAIAGLLLEGKIDGLFHVPGVPVQPAAMIAVAVILALFGSIMYLADRLATHLRGMAQLGLKDSLVIGVAQALAVFPGVSRSGATITAGLALGLKRPAAARFSFLLSAPIIAGAGLKSLFDVYHSVRSGSIVPSELVLFAVGFVSATVSGYLCIRFMLRYLQGHSINVFVYYRWAVALLIAVVALVRA